MCAAGQAVEEPVLLQSLERGVLRLCMNRPSARNALNRQLAHALISAFHAAEFDNDVRVVVLTGNGSGFCAGDDVTTHDDPTRIPRDPHDGVVLYTRIAALMVRCPKPVMAVITGAVAGAGLEIACAADLRVAVRGASFGSGLVKVGQPGSAVMLPRVIGSARATALYLSGRFIGADEALALGLVSEVWDVEQFDEGVNQWVDRLASGPTKAIGMFKQIRQANEQLDVFAALSYQDWIHQRAQTEIRDGREGFVAFLEKRPPQFTGE